VCWSVGESVRSSSSWCVFFMFHRCWCAGRRCGPTMSTLHRACGRAAARPRRGPTLPATSRTRPGARLPAAPIPGEHFVRGEKRDALSKNESESYKNIVCVNSTGQACALRPKSEHWAMNANGQENGVKERRSSGREPDNCSWVA
jgi:hypothetical protein